jgi:hypothetical protein
MGLEDLRRWHWAGIGIVAGLAFAAVRHSTGAELALDDVPGSLNVRRDFERGLIAAPATHNKITDVTIFPPDKEGRIWMTFLRFQNTRQLVDPKDPSKGTIGKGTMTKFWVTEPYKPEAVQPTDPATTGSLTVRQYLASLQQQFPDAQISYRYAWWYEPVNMYALGASAGLVLIGGIWPSIIGLLTGGGIMGPPRRAKDEDEEYLSRFGKGGPEPIVTTATATTGDDGKLAELEDAMLANLNGFGSGGEADRDGGSIDEDAPVRPLTGGPLESPEEVAAREEQAKREYAGDYYPVARPGGAKKVE